MKITDTIAAISSAAGNSGIGIIRVSGDEAIEVVDKIFRPANKNKKLANVESHTVHYGHIMDGDKIHILIQEKIQLKLIVMEVC